MVGRFLGAVIQMTETKKCEFCGAKVERGKLSDYNWKQTKFCKPCRLSWRRNKTKYDTCIRCGETKPTFRFKKRETKKGYCQPCKACDARKNKVGGDVQNTKHLDPYLTIPWTRAA